MYFGGTGFLDGANAVAALGNFWTSASSEMKCGGNVRVGFKVQDVNPVNGEVTGEAGITPANVSLGGAVGTMLPTATQLRADLITGVFIGGRGVVGGLFLPACDESRNTSGVPDATLQTNLGTWLSTLIADPNSTPQVYSPTHRSVHTITGFRVRPYWSVRRSRRD